MDGFFPSWQVQVHARHAQPEQHSAAEGSLRSVSAVYYCLQRECDPGNAQNTVPAKEHSPTNHVPAN